MENTWIELYDYQTRHTFYINKNTDKWRKDRPVDVPIVKADPLGVWSVWNDESQMHLYYNSKTMKWARYPSHHSGTVVSLSLLVKKPSMRRYIYLPPVSFNNNHKRQMPKWKYGRSTDQHHLHENDTIISKQTISAFVQTNEQKQTSLPITQHEASRFSVSPKIKKQNSLLQSTSSIESAKISPRSFKKHVATPQPLLISRQNQDGPYLSNASDTSTTHVQYRPCTSPKNQCHAPWIYSPPSPLSLVTSSSSESSSPASPPSLTPLSPLSPLSLLSPLSPHNQLNNTFDINKKYVFENYAALHFTNHKRGFFLRTPISSTIMAQWTKNSIPKPLLKTTNKKYTKDAIECFKKIQMIMGDRPRKSHGRSDDVTDIQSILTMGITGGQDICDEIYVQLCKQLNHNPGSISSQNGWELLSVLCSTIPPSNKLALYIIQLLHDHHHPQVTSPTKLASNNASDDNIPLPSISSYLSLKVRRICQKGAHGKVPCRAEIQLDRMAIVRQKQDPDGCTNVRTVSTMVFGTPLDIIMKNQQRLDEMTTTRRKRRPIKIPQIVPFLIRAIRQLGGNCTQGIFRIAGLADTVTSLRLQIENGLYIKDGSGSGQDLDVCCGDPNVPASLLRLWLRELPSPLIPVEYYDRCINHSSDLVSVMMIVDDLPDVNRRILMYIIGFIQEYLSPQVCQRTLMTVSNLAMVFAPNFLRGPLSDNLVLALHKSKYEQMFVKTLLLGPKVDMNRHLYG